MKMHSLELVLVALGKDSKFDPFGSTLFRALALCRCRRARSNFPNALEEQPSWRFEVQR